MIAGNGDTSHGPIITIDGIKVQTYLVQLIDDASRLIVGYHFFLNDTALNFQHVLKQAIKTIQRKKLSNEEIDSVRQEIDNLLSIL